VVHNDILLRIAAQTAWGSRSTSALSHPVSNIDAWSMNLTLVGGELAEPGPVFSRLDRLLPIGPRAKGGPALRLLIYANANVHFLLQLLL